MDHAKLLHPAPPFTHRLTAPAAWSAAAEFCNKNGFSVHVFPGAALPNREVLFERLANSFQFPPYFGENWDALFDCLTDLAWLPAQGYLIVITEADRFMHEEPDRVSSFISVVESVAAEWAGRESAERRPFHLILQTG